MHDIVNAITKKKKNYNAVIKKYFFDAAINLSYNYIWLMQ